MAALADKTNTAASSTDANPIASTAPGSSASSLANAVDLDYANSLQPGLRKQQLSWDEICRRAAKVVSFIDLAGHERYLKASRTVTWTDQLS